MEGIRSYLLGVIAAAIICGIVTRLMGDKGTQGTVAKLIAGLFLAFTVIQPVAKLDIGKLSDFPTNYADLGAEYASRGEQLTQEALAASIKQRTEAYILDKADDLDVTLTVEVTLTKDKIPTASSVRLSGKVSPYARGRLQTIIQEDLGIDKEHQTWI